MSCECQCGGSFHSALADTEITTDRDIRPWWVRCDNGGWAEHALREFVPEIGAIPSGNNHWEKCRAAQKPYLVIRRSGPGWVVELDLAPLGRPDHELATAWSHAEPASELLTELLGTGRITATVEPPSSYVYSDGIQDKHEARVIAVLVFDGFQGNRDGIDHATSVLRSPWKN